MGKEGDGFDQLLAELSAKGNLSTPPFVVQESPSQSHLLEMMDKVREKAEKERERLRLEQLKNNFSTTLSLEIQRRLKPGVALGGIVKDALLSAIDQSKLDTTDKRVRSFILETLSELGLLTYVSPAGMIKNIIE